MKNRIQPIDGLRTFAAFGVIWIHTWAYCGNPSFKIGTFDLYKVVAIVGNGVDFFFVISGFCMYLMAGSKEFNVKGYGQFIYKRFLRIAPAFYVAVLIYAAFVEKANPSFQFVQQVSYHFLFLNNITGNSISGPFWSIATEWHFYMILPLCILLSKKISLPKALLILSVCSLVLFCFVNKGFLPYRYWESQILVRFPEFAVGIYAAYIFKQGKSVPKLFNGLKGLILALMIMYIGRYLKFTPFIEWTGCAGFFFKSIADTVMVIGFGILLLHVITQPSALSIFLSGKIITWLGRISYSIYLWHSLIFILLGNVLVHLKGSSFSVPIIFVLVSLGTIIFSYFSYKYLESFYFKSQMIVKKKRVFVHGPVSDSDTKSSFVN